MNTYDKDVRLAQRWFPKGSMPINHPEGLAVVYVSPFDSSKGTWQAVAYRGTAGRPSFNNSYRSLESAQKLIGEWFEAVSADKKRVIERRADANKPHTLKVGDVITNSWGYDQTNVDCYQITRTSSNFVWLRPIATQLVPDEGVGPMSGRVVPIPNQFQDKPEKQHKASGEYVSFKYGSGSKWDGRSLYCSWYA